MLKKICFLVMFLGISSAVVAQAPALNPDRPKQYTVRKGDTMWSIARNFLQQPWQWPVIWRGNPEIEDPYLIYPGDIIRLDYVDGQPVLSASSPTVSAEAPTAKQLPEAEEETVARQLPEAEEETVARLQAEPTNRYVKLSPKVRVQEKRQIIPLIPIGEIKPFLRSRIIVSETEMNAWPYVVSSSDEHLIMATGNKIYIRGLPDEVGRGVNYSVYRRGDSFVRSGTKKEVLGYEAIYLGDVTIVKRGDPAPAFVLNTQQEILVGDRLKRATFRAAVVKDFVPRSPTRNIDAAIISVVESVRYIGQYDIVVIDVGKDGGVEVGSVLGVYEHNPVMVDMVAPATRAKNAELTRIEFKHEDTSAFARMLSTLANDMKNVRRSFDKTILGQYMGPSDNKPDLTQSPLEQNGVLMVFLSFSNLSYALVMEATNVIQLHDKVQNL